MNDLRRNLRNSFLNRDSGEFVSTKTIVLFLHAKSSTEVYSFRLTNILLRTAGTWSSYNSGICKKVWQNVQYFSSIYCLVGHKK